MRSDLGFTEQSLGFIVSAFFASGAVTAILARRRLDRVGGRRTAWVAAALGAVALASIAGLVTTWQLLLVALLVAGGGLGLMVPVTRACSSPQPPRSPTSGA